MFSTQLLEDFFSSVLSSKTSFNLSHNDLFSSIFDSCSVDLIWKGGVLGIFFACTHLKCAKNGLKGKDVEKQITLYTNYSVGIELHLICSLDHSY